MQLLGPDGRSPGSHPAPEELAAFGDRQLGDAETGYVEAHVRGCEQCTAELGEHARMLDMLRQLPELAAPRSFLLDDLAVRRPARSVWPAWVSLAASVVLALGMIGALQRTNGSPFAASAPSEHAAVVDTTSGEADAPEAAGGAAGGASSGEVQPEAVSTKGAAGVPESVTTEESAVGAVAQGEPVATITFSTSAAGPKDAATSPEAAAANPAADSVVATVQADAIGAKTVEPTPGTQGGTASRVTPEESADQSANFPAAVATAESPGTGVAYRAGEARPDEGRHGAGAADETIPATLGILSVLSFASAIFLFLRARFFF